MIVSPATSNKKNLVDPNALGTQQGSKPNVPKKKFQGKAKSKQINTADSVAKAATDDFMAGLRANDPNAKESFLENNRQNVVRAIQAGERQKGNKPKPPFDPTDTTDNPDEQDTDNLKKKFKGTRKVLNHSGVEEEMLNPKDSADLMRRDKKLRQERYKSDSGGNVNLTNRSK